MQSPLLEFDSSAFAIIPGEDEETNPEIYGKALALWLAEQLRATGVPAGDVFAEDFGWCVPIDAKPHALHVVCASMGDANAGEQQNHWGVFAFAEGGPRDSRGRTSERSLSRPCSQQSGAASSRRPRSGDYAKKPDDAPPWTDRPAAIPALSRRQAPSLSSVTPQLARVLYFGA
jgi:hypothetical protein